jgi:hypothetical protein
MYARIGHDKMTITTTDFWGNEIEVPKVFLKQYNEETGKKIDEEDFDWDDFEEWFDENEDIREKYSCKIVDKDIVLFLIAKYQSLNEEHDFADDSMEFEDNGFKYIIVSYGAIEDNKFDQQFIGWKEKINKKV